MDAVPENKALFVFPQLLGAEMGELERVAAYVGEPAKSFVPRFLKATLPKNEKMRFTELPDSVWSQLKNTDSADVTKGDWEAVKRASEGKRDWESIRRKMERGERLDAPIIIKLPNEYHLVSGNTRLMCAKALGLVPKVLFVDLSA